VNQREDQLQSTWDKRSFCLIRYTFLKKKDLAVPDLLYTPQIIVIDFLKNRTNIDLIVGNSAGIIFQIHSDFVIYHWHVYSQINNVSAVWLINVN
jgi:hypothetical protein